MRTLQIISLSVFTIFLTACTNQHLTTSAYEQDKSQCSKLVLSPSISSKTLSMATDYVVKNVAVQHVMGESILGSDARKLEKEERLAKENATYQCLIKQGYVFYMDGYTCSSLMHSELCRS
jgi:hypothetical protein